MIARTLGPTPVRVVLWDGTEFETGEPAAIAKIHIRSRRALVLLLVHPQLYFGECFANGSLEVEGDLPDTLTSMYEAMDEPHGLQVAVAGLYAHLHRIDPSRSRHNVHHHYDLGNDFCRLWLDERMVDTCAYFPSADATLEEAQIAKLDHVCRKLRLRSGEHVLEAGCGWGALAMHMADRYGARVRAFNVSHEQVAYARETAARAGLTDRVEFIEDDYRSATGPCDAFVSVGMLEHVGPPDYRDLGRLIRRAHRRGQEDRRLRTGERTLDRRRRVRRRGARRRRRPFLPSRTRARRCHRRSRPHGRRSRIRAGAGRPRRIERRGRHPGTLFHARSCRLRLGIPQSRVSRHRPGCPHPRLRPDQRESSVRSHRRIPRVPRGRRPDWQGAA